MGKRLSDANTGPSILTVQKESMGEFADVPDDTVAGSMLLRI